jgi:hypothetical protein
MATTPTQAEQIQAYVNLRVRVRAEQIRALLLSMEDDRAAFDDIYALLTDPGVSWVDTRSDGPSHFLTPSDVLAWNTFLFNAITAQRADAQLPIVLKACIRSLGQSGVVPIG